MWWAVDQLGHEYGWSKREILEEVYFDELLELLPKIHQRKIKEYQMDLALIQNPHVKDPKKLWDELLTADRYAKFMDERDRNPYGTFDEAGFALLRAKMSKSPNIIVKPLPGQ